MKLDVALAHGHGVLCTAQLRRCGLAIADVRRMVQRGELELLRHGWYAAPGADPRVRMAVSVGGVLTCLAALRLHGFWTPTGNQIHVRFTQHGMYRSGLPKQHATVRACSAELTNRRPTQSVDGALLALSAAPGCASDEEIVAIIDSMLHSARVERDAVETALRSHPQRIRTLVDLCDPLSESGTESLVRVRLRRRNIAVRPQVRISGIGRVDLLVGRRLVIEVDSIAHHTGELAYESDRRRDRLLVERGYLVMRMSYAQVVGEWNAVEQSVLAVVRRREHLRFPAECAQNATPEARHDNNRRAGPHGLRYVQ